MILRTLFLITIGCSNCFAADDSQTQQSDKDIKLLQDHAKRIRERANEIERSHIQPYIDDVLKQTAFAAALAELNRYGDFGFYVSLHAVGAISLFLSYMLIDTFSGIRLRPLISDGGALLASCLIPLAVSSGFLIKLVLEERACRLSVTPGDIQRAKNEVLSKINFKIKNPGEFLLADVRRFSRYGTNPDIRRILLAPASAPIEFGMSSIAVHEFDLIPQYLADYDEDLDRYSNALEVNSIRIDPRFEAKGHLVRHLLEVEYLRSLADAVEAAIPMDCRGALAELGD